MPSIDIQSHHNLGVSKAKERVENVAKQLKNRLGVEYHWQGDTLDFSRPGATGTIEVEATVVNVHVELGMMLTPFKGEVQKQIQGYLDAELS